MNEFKNLNGYTVKDAEARNRITYLENNAIEGYDASWILDSETRTAENFKDLYDVLIFNSTDHSSLDYKNKKIDIFIKVEGLGNINCETETLRTITVGTSYEDSAYKIELMNSQLDTNNIPAQVIYEITKNTEGNISYNFKLTSLYQNTIISGSFTAEEISLLPKDMCILSIRGINPFLSKKYDIEKHKNYDLLLDSNENNFFVKKNEKTEEKIFEEIEKVEKIVELEEVEED